MIFLTFLGAAAISAAPVPAAKAATPEAQAQAGAIRAEFAGRETTDHNSMEWERYDVRFTNSGAASKTLSVCPGEQRFFLQRPQRYVNPGQVETFRSHAIALDGESWRFDCRESALGAGESVTVSVYYRVHVDSWNRTWPRAALVRTSAGSYLVHDDRLERYEAGARLGASRGEAG